MTPRVRRRPWTVWLVVAGVVLAGCGPKVSVRGERSRIATFGRYRTYAWAEGPTPARTAEAMRAALTEWRIRRGLERGLAAKGYVPTQGEPSLLVDYDVAVGAARSPTFDYFQSRHRDGFAAGYPPGTLVVHLIDPRTGEIAYRASATGVIQEPPDTKRLEKAVERMLDDLPAAMAGQAGAPPRRR